jgi:hypothetical protein
LFKFMEMLGRSGGSGDFTGVVKFDSRSGKILRVDRVQGPNGWESELEEITSSFKAAFDLENTMVGPMQFVAGTKPVFNLVKIGQPVPAPVGDQRSGIQVKVLLDKSCGGDLREIASSAGAFLRGFGELYEEYAKYKAANPGKLPVVTVKKFLPVTTGAGSRKSTNWQPQFSIDAWVPRPAELKSDDVGFGNAA